MNRFTTILVQDHFETDAPRQDQVFTSLTSTRAKADLFLNPCLTCRMIRIPKVKGGWLRSLPRPAARILLPNSTQISDQGKYQLSVGRPFGIIDFPRFVRRIIPLHLYNITQSH